MTGDRYRVVFTSLADADLDTLIDHIAGDSPENAIRFVEQLRDRAIKVLAQFPASGTAFGSARYFAFDDHIVVYDIHDDQRTVVVHMITHGSRQWRAHFERRRQP